MRIYLDYAATTPIDPRVLEAMAPYWTEHFGNPSSSHGYGKTARDAVEQARSSLASLLGADPAEIVFNSGGSEGDNTALKGVAYAMQKKGNHIITTAVEHHAVLHTCDFLETQGFQVTRLPVDHRGQIDPDRLVKAITPQTILISVMHANNEVGTLQPVAETGRLARERSILFHTDAVQTFGHIPLNVDALNADLLSISAHKLSGPKGVGALYIRDKTPFEPFLHGGAQESGRRSSTHNVPGIVGLAEAAIIAHNEMKEDAARIKRLRDRLSDHLLRTVEGSVLNGHPVERLDNNIHLSIPGVEGESLLMHLDMAGIAASSGSACSSGSADPSHVLLAMGFSPEAARGSLRLSLGKATAEEEVEQVMDMIPEIVKRLRSLSPN
jgi:cysteine desulfurase